MGTSLVLWFLGRQRKNLGIASYAADDLHLPSSSADQRSIKPVSAGNKLPLGQPVHHFVKHFFGQIDQIRLVFSKQPHIDGQSQRFATPGSFYADGKDHQLQSPGIDNFGSGRPDGIAMPTGSMNLSPAAVKDGIVQIQKNNSIRTKNRNQQDGQQPPEFAGHPASIGIDSMKSVVRTFLLGIGERKDARGGSSGRAEDPAGHQLHENNPGGLGENRKKILDQRRPCRYSSGHTNLLLYMVVLIFLPLQSSGGWYYFVRKILKLVT